MTKERRKDKLRAKLRKQVSKYLNDRVITPAFETIEKDFYAQDHLVDMLLIVELLVEQTYKHGLGFDKEYLRGLSKGEIEKRIEVLGDFIKKVESNDTEEMSSQEEALSYLHDDSSRKYLLAYLKREINWIVVSVLAASYVSSLILMRSVFELIVGIASRSTESMGNRIDCISHLDETEKDAMKKLWYRLCAWGHPYGRWVKEICPIYAESKPLYNPKLSELCLQELMEIVDFFALVTIVKYEIGATELVEKAREFGVDLRGFKLVQARVRI